MSTRQPSIDGGAKSRPISVPTVRTEPRREPRNIRRRPVKLPPMVPIREQDREAYDAFEEAA